MSNFPPSQAEAGTPPMQGGAVGVPNAFYASPESSGISPNSQDAFLFAQQSAILAQAPAMTADPHAIPLSQTQVGYMADGCGSQHVMQAEAYMHWDASIPQQVAPGEPYAHMPPGMGALGPVPGAFPGAALPFSSAPLVGPARSPFGPGENASVVSRSGLGGQRRLAGPAGKAAPSLASSHLQANRELARKQQTALRRGLFLATELEDWMGEDCPGLDRQCIIRFPPPIAALLRKRLSTVTSPEFHNSAKSEAIGTDGSPQGPSYPPGCSAANPLGLTIIPRDEWSYRIFDVKVSGHKGKLLGVLVELPTLVETYKSLDGDLLFKSGDICQMIVVCDPQDPREAIDVQDLSERQQWEWKAGLTPPTHRIRSRKFKNLDLFDRQEIRDAELQVLELLHSTRRDNYEIEVHTLHEMHRILEQQREAAEGKAPKPTAPGATANGTAVVEHVVSCDDDVLAWLDSAGMLHGAVLEPEGEGSFSDYSDILFDYTPVVGGAAGAMTTFGARGPGGPRGSRGRSAWRTAAASQPGVPVSHESLVFGGADGRAAQLEDEDGAGSAVEMDRGDSGGPVASGPCPVLVGVGPGEMGQPQAPVVEYPGRESAVPGGGEDLEARLRRKEERRQKKLLKKEKRRLKKEKKKAKRDKKKQVQGSGATRDGDEGGGLAGGQSAGSATQGDASRGEEAGEKDGSSSSSSSDEEDGGRDDDTLL
uniref:TAF7-like RNA polymerase II TAF7L n=1 Tax=Neospora caninum (strain Liverpool) TaxID=572307 RepID=A0A0F7UKV0_NEOCL|nr:TPA: TAF7-like RNA polymerase II TAF7L [Neospora caninum Liverpool]